MVLFLLLSTEQHPREKLFPEEWRLSGHQKRSRHGGQFSVYYFKTACDALTKEQRLTRIRPCLSDGWNYRRVKRPDQPFRIFGASKSVSSYSCVSQIVKGPVGRLIVLHLTVAIREEEREKYNLICLACCHQPDINPEKTCAFGKCIFSREKSLRLEESTEIPFFEPTSLWGRPRLLLHPTVWLTN